jgi:large conductance mechanosensitive channel
VGLVKEFKKFALRGNVVDLAVGIIIGGAFGKIVSSLVGDIVMPLVGTITGRGSLKDEFLWLGGGEKPATLEAARAAEGAYMAWGNFGQTTLDFLIIALAVFMMVKIMNEVQDQFAEEPEEKKPAPPEDVQLLREIRDLLKKE